MPKYNVFVSYTAHVEAYSEAKALTDVSYDLQYIRGNNKPTNITIQARDENDFGAFGLPAASIKSDLPEPQTPEPVPEITPYDASDIPF